MLQGACECKTYLPEAETCIRNSCSGSIIIPNVNSLSQACASITSTSSQASSTIASTTTTASQSSTQSRSQTPLSTSQTTTGGSPTGSVPSYSYLDPGPTSTITRSLVGPYPYPNLTTSHMPSGTNYGNCTNTSCNPLQVTTNGVTPVRSTNTLLHLMANTGLMMILLGVGAV